jgi:ribosomal protein S18 acetylase RimI-like enzyme
VTVEIYFESGACGANELAVQAYAQNDGALAFYRAQGFRPSEVTLVREA